MTMAWHKRFWIRLTHWEFWPTWVVYLPVLLCYPIWAMRAGSFYFYANVNPGMAMGGLYGASKKSALDPIPEGNKPKTLSFAPGTDVDAVMSVVHEAGLSFPLWSNQTKANVEKALKWCTRRRSFNLRSVRTPRHF